MAKTEVIKLYDIHKVPGLVIRSTKYGLEIDATRCLLIPALSQEHYDEQTRDFEKVGLPTDPEPPASR